MDFRGATKLFADPDFDGDPVQIYEPTDAQSPVPPDDPGEANPDGAEASGDDGGENDGSQPDGSPRRSKYYVDDVEVSAVSERVQYLDGDGKLITETLKDYTRKTVRQQYQSLNAFLSAWSDAERKQAIVEELARQGVFLGACLSNVARKKSTSQEAPGSTIGSSAMVFLPLNLPIFRLLGQAPS